MFSHTHKFILSHNRGRMLVLGIPLCAFVLTSLLAGLDWPSAWFVAAPKEYWGRFMPMAGFAATAAMAYLALEMFRHAIHVDAMVRDMFKATTEEDRKGLVKSVEELTRAETQSNLQLILMILLFQLADARGQWVKQMHEPDEEKRSQERTKLEKKLQATRSEAEKEEWFRKGTGRVFLGCFLYGRDTVIVSACLLFAVWIHVLATIEKMITLQIPAIATHWSVQLVIVVCLGACVVIPLTYVFLGRKLLDEIAYLADLGREQHEARLTEIPANDARTVEQTNELLAARAAAQQGPRA